MNKPDLKHQISKTMKRQISHIIVAVMFLSVAVTSCKKEKDEENVMTMTTSASGEVTISLAGTGSATIDWGDDSAKETKTIFPYNATSPTQFNHNYSETKICTMKIYGENVTYLNCNYLQLTSLDVSNNTALTELYLIDSQLTSLDVNENIALTWLNCANNQLTAAALDDLFGTLHNNSTPVKKFIVIYGNPGTNDCNISIATDKGWEPLKSLDDIFNTNQK